SVLKEIKVPETQSTAYEDVVLSFIKEQYTKIYKKEEINLNATNLVTQNLPSVSEQENLALM
ncbi:37435_t:CDS:1, partial [Gigaspora margarita]